MRNRSAIYADAFVVAIVLATVAFVLATEVHILVAITPTVLGSIALAKAYKYETKAYRKDN